MKDKNLMKTSLILGVLLIGMLQSVAGIAMVTDLNGTVTMTNNYSENQIHTTTATHTRFQINETNGEHHRYNMTERRISNNTYVRQVNISANASNGSQMRFHAPRVRRNTNICSEELKNLTSIRKMMTKTYRIEVGKSLDIARGEVILAGMDAVIEKAQEYHANATQIIEIRDKFSNILNELNNTTGKEYAEDARMLMRLAEQFKIEAHKIPELDQHADEVREDAINAMRTKRSELENRIRKELKLAKEIGMAVFELHMCEAQERLNQFYNMGMNVSLAQQKLDEIKAMKTELEQAYASGNRTAVARIKSEIARKWMEFYKEFSELNRMSIEHRYEIARERMINAINKLKKMGKNTSDMENKIKQLDKMRNQLNNAEEMHKFANKMNELNREIAENAREVIEHGRGAR